jgi:tetratricopeptide (TPR) repeat protein
VHLQKIHESYPKDAVQVVFVISQPADYIRTSYFPVFKQTFQVDYLGLDDAKNDVVNRYGLRADASIAKDIIVDRDGNVRLIGEFVPRAQMERVIDTLLGKTGEVDGATPDAAKKALAGSDVYARWKAARALGAMGEKSAVPALAAALGDASGSVRECAADALGALGDPSAGEVLLARVGDSSPAVKCAVMTALGRLRHAPAAEPLRAALKDSAPSVRAAAAIALGAIPDTGAGDALLAAAKDASNDVRAAVLLALGQIKEPRAATVLVDALATRALRARTARALAELGQREAVEKAIAARWPGAGEPDRSELLDIYATMATASLAARTYDDGIAWCRKALERGGPSMAHLHECLGDLYLGKGDMPKALAEYDLVNPIVVKESGNASLDANAYNNTSWFYVQKKVRPAEALALAKKAVELAPGDVNARDTLGWAYINAGDVDNALLAYEKVFATDQTFQSSWDGVAALAANPSAREKVAKFCSDLAARYPGNDQVKSGVAEVRAALAKAKA